MRRLLFLVTTVLTLTALPCAAAEKAVTPEEAQFFETRIRPVLADSCFRCHGPAKQRGGLRLDSRAALLAGGDRGPAVVPGDPEKSLLITAVGHTDDLKMPPSKKLPAQQVGDLTRWVRLGAPWPGADEAVPVTTRRGEFRITDRDRAHWAFQPVRRPDVPAVKDRAWVANPVDAF